MRKSCPFLEKAVGERSETDDGGGDKNAFGLNAALKLVDPVQEDHIGAQHQQRRQQRRQSGDDQHPTRQIIDPRGVSARKHEHCVEHARDEHVAGVAAGVADDFGLGFALHGGAPQSQPLATATATNMLTRMAAQAAGLGCWQIFIAISSSSDRYIISSLLDCQAYLSRLLAGRESGLSKAMS